MIRLYLYAKVCPNGCKLHSLSDDKKSANNLTYLEAKQLLSNELPRIDMTHGLFMSTTASGKYTH